jgi:hypothetical protein
MRRTDALRGNVSIGGKKYGILIWDREMGGYSNESNISIAVDANQDGRFNTAAGSDETYHFFGKPVIFRGTQFYLKGISSDHTKLMVTDMAQTTLTHNNASVGGTVQEFTAKDRDGKLFSLSESLKSNDYAILVFFFSACGGCADLNSKLQLPPQEVLRHFLNKYCGKTTIVGIEAAGDTAARLDSATTISSSTRKHVNDSTTEWDLNSIPLVNNVSGFPCMLIVDKKRRIVYRGYECSVDWILRDLWTNIGRTDYQKVLTELSDMNKAQAHN